MNPHQRERLAFIEFLLVEYGTVNRTAISDYFGLSPQQASHDLQSYVALAPGNMAYDLSAKTYRRTATFKRVWE